MNNGLASGNIGLERRGEKARKQKHEGGTKYCTGARSPPGSPSFGSSSACVAPCASLTWVRNSNALFAEPVRYK